MNKHMFSEAEKRFFLEYTYGHSRKEIGEEFERRFGLKLTENQIKKQCMYAGGTGRTGHFEKGNKNRFDTGFDEMTERVHVGGRKGKEIKVKVNGKWIRKKRYIWEQAYGKVPDDKILLFKDGNPLNCTLDNLVLVGKDVNTEMARRHYHKLDGEMYETATLISVLEIERKKHEKRAGQKRNQSNIDENQQTDD